MIRRLFFFICVLYFSKSLFGQDIPDFTFPMQGCLLEKIKLTNISAGSQFEWDFCEGDLQLTPSLTLKTASTLNIPIGVSLIKSSDKWFGFICNLGSNELVRLDFGESLLNENPTVTNLGNIGGLLNGPQDIKIIEFNQEYFAFVFNRGINKLIRIDFGSDLITNNPSAEVVMTGGAAVNGGIDVVLAANSWIVAVSNYNSLTIGRLGSDPRNIPGAPDIMVTSIFPSLGGIGDIKFAMENDLWFGFISGYDSRSVHRLAFGSDLFSDPVSTILTHPVLGSSPYGIVVEKENNTWNIFLSTSQGNLLSLDLGSNILNNAPAFTDFGNSGILANALKMDIARAESRWLALTTNWNSKNFFLIKFPEAECGFNKSFSYNSDTVLLKSVNSGDHYISLLQKNNGYTTKVSKKVEVLDKNSPAIDFSVTSICENTSSTFNPTADQTIDVYNWDLGIYGSSIDRTPSVSLGPNGDYPILLYVTAENGCNNYVEKSIKIYDPPDAAFTAPTGLICTNNQFTFVNSTVDNFNGNLTYEWLVNDVLESTARDFMYAFTAGGDQQVKLKTSIPGCSDELIQTISNVQIGPVVDFSYIGKCEDESVVFTNASSGSISGYQWDFDNRNTSTEVNPSEIYSTQGNYDVSLVTTGTNGCTSTKSKPIIIYSKPQPDFSLDLPPFSCQGTPSQFNDLTPNPTDSNLSSWAWDFGDAANGSSTQRNPLYTYSAAGPYSVSLDVTTNFGCNATVQKMVAITTAPPINFTTTPACVNQPTQFTDASGSGVKSWLWKIDNSTYIINNPVHTFTTAGSHNVELTITGANDCIGQMTKTVMVPVATTPDFSVENACSEKPTAFIDITGGADPVITRNWDFAGLGSASGASTTYTFPIGGNYTVKLNTTHQSGCAYLAAKSITIGTSPTSLFTSSAEGGPPPLTIKFSNSSTGAGSYLWKFNDKANTTSLLAEPSFTFNELGDYQVELTSFGQQGCADTFSKPIRIVEPKTDLSLISLELLSDPTSGSLRPVVTIKNNGNIAVTNVSILMDLSGGGSIKEKMQINLQPNLTFTQALVSELLPKGLSYICAEVKLENDENLFDNKICSTLADEVILFAPYPNPSHGQLHIDWIAASGDVANIVIFNSTGGNAYDKEITVSQPGLSQIILDISTLGPGIYFAVFSYGDFTKTHRFMVN